MEDDIVWNSFQIPGMNQGDFLINTGSRANFVGTTWLLGDWYVRKMISCFLQIKLLLLYVYIK